MVDSQNSPSAGFYERCAGTEPPPLISVLVPVYNGADFIDEALDSALHQDFNDFEVIVVDDGSTDASSIIASERAGSTDIPVRVIKQINQGLPSARNKAIAAARGRLFALLDADDVWLPDHLRIAAAQFTRNPELGLVHANIEYIDASGKVLSVPRRDWAAQRDTFRALALRLEHVSCPTAVFAKWAIDRVGGFDSTFSGLGCEDRDLWLRIAEIAPICYLNRVSARYRVHSGSMSARRERMYQARMLLAEKVSLSPAGKSLRRSMKAMIKSDQGLELSEAGKHWPAITAQLKACFQQPMLPIVWRRLVQAIVVALMPRRRIQADLVSRARAQGQRT